MPEELEGGGEGRGGGEEEGELEARGGEARGCPETHVSPRPRLKARATVQQTRERERVGGGRTGGQEKRRRTCPHEGGVTHSAARDGKELWRRMPITGLSSHRRAPPPSAQRAPPAL